MENNKPIIAITHGDTNGIGYELIFKTFVTPEMLEICTPIIYGSPKVAAYHRKALDMPAIFSIINKAEDALDGHINLLTCFEEDVKVSLGNTTPESQQAARKALDRALDDFSTDCYDALVTIPFEMEGEKGTINPDAYIAAKMDREKEAMQVFANDSMRIGLATNDMALKDVAAGVTLENIKTKATILHTTIRRDFRILNPRIAILSLNPNANGKEEEESIKPAISQLQEAHIQAYGPYAVGDLFGTNQYKAFDGILAMYHDQGVTPFKTIQGGTGIKLLANIPIVCTSPDNGTEMESAGKGIGNEQSLRQAIFTAIDIARNRIMYDEPYAHPLPKLYHEKRDEGEKIRFSIPKKHENSIKEK